MLFNYSTGTSVTLNRHWCCCSYFKATTYSGVVWLHRRSYLSLQEQVESSWDVMAHGDAREGKWRGNWRMEWVASTLHTTSEHGVSSITAADAHNSGASSRLNWRPPADLNGLVRFAERRNLVSARVPSHFKRSLLLLVSKVMYGVITCTTNWRTALWKWFPHTSLRPFKCWLIKENSSRPV